MSLGDFQAINGEHRSNSIGYLNLPVLLVILMVLNFVYYVKVIKG